MICFFSCSSNEEECIKTVTIQQFYTVGNEIHSYNQEIDIPCGVNELTEPVNIEPPLLDGFSYEVINFEYTSDTGNNTTRLQFEIKLILFKMKLVKSKYEIYIYYFLKDFFLFYAGI